MYAMILGAQSGEAVDLPPFNSKLDRPMMEMNSGSNVWYQAIIQEQNRSKLLVLFPGDVPDVAAGQERVPLFLGQALIRLASFDSLARAAAAEGESPGVTRIVEDLQGPAVDDGSPHQFALGRSLVQPAREQQLLVAEEADCGGG